MAKRGSWRRCAGGALVAVVAASAPAAAQELIPSPHVGFVGGAFLYDFGPDQEGTTATFGLRLELPLHRWFGVELGLGYARGSSPLLLGDLQVQARYPMDLQRGGADLGVAPYLGLGVGGALDLRDDRQPEEDFVALTYTASAGTRIDIGGPFQLLGEVRLRGIGEVAREVMEIVLGAGVAF